MGEVFPEEKNQGSKISWNFLVNEFSLQIFSFFQVRKRKVAEYLTVQSHRKLYFILESINWNLYFL